MRKSPKIATAYGQSSLRPSTTHAEQSHQQRQNVKALTASSNMLLTVCKRDYQHTALLKDYSPTHGCGAEALGRRLGGPKSKAETPTSYEVTRVDLTLHLCDAGCGGIFTQLYMVEGCKVEGFQSTRIVCLWGKGWRY